MGTNWIIAMIALSVMAGCVLGWFMREIDELINDSRSWESNIYKAPFEVYIDVKYRWGNSFIVLKAKRHHWGWKPWCGCNICEDDIIAWRKINVQ